MTKLFQFTHLYMNCMFFSCLAFIFILERLSKRFYIPTGIKDKGLDRWCKNFIFGLINRYLLPLITFPISVYAIDHTFNCRLYGFLGDFGLIVDVVILDFSSYGFHRLCHKIHFLWCLHEVHHLDSAFDVTTGLRIHFGELFFANLFRSIPIMLFSIPLTSVIIFEFILLMQWLFHHSNIKMPMMLNVLLGFVIVTPERHSVHHHASQIDTDYNYGFIFIIWDKLFKTFNSNIRLSSWRIGLNYSSDVALVNLIFTRFKFNKFKTRSKKNQ